MSIRIEQIDELKVVIDGAENYAGKIYMTEDKRVLFQVPTYANLTTVEVREILIRMETIEKEGLP